MNALTRLCLTTTADVLEQIVHAIRGTQATEPAQPFEIHIHCTGCNSDAPHAPSRNRFGIPRR